MESWQRSYFDEPFGVATEVAPTERAIILEYERHRLQRAAGVVPAGRTATFVNSGHRRDAKRARCRRSRGEPPGRDRTSAPARLSR